MRPRKIHYYLAISENHTTKDYKNTYRVELLDTYLLDRMLNNSENSYTVHFLKKTKKNKSVEEMILTLFKHKYKAVPVIVDYGDSIFKDYAYQMFQGDIDKMIQDVVLCLKDKSEWDFKDVLKILGITDIIITNFENHTGHILLKKQNVWTEAVDVKAYIKNNLVTSKYDINKVLLDIHKMHYSSSAEKFYHLKYYEYLLGDVENVYFILNLKDWTVTKCETSRSNVIVKDKFAQPINITMLEFEKLLRNPNRHIVDCAIIQLSSRSSSKHNINVQEFQNLCYDVLVEQNKSNIIVDASACLTFMMTNMMFNLMQSDTYLYVDLNVDKNGAAAIKKVRDMNKLRLVCFQPLQNQTVRARNAFNTTRAKVTVELMHLGVKNFIVMDNEKFGLYHCDIVDNALDFNWHFLGWCCERRDITDIVVEPDGILVDDI